MTEEINSSMGTEPSLSAVGDHSESDLILLLQGFEGPIDLLLCLAREQKVDLSTISILPLAEQYLAFIASARKVRLEIAADYLVMAAWLAYLKSRLLIPDAKEEEPNPADMADALRFQLLRLEAMQKAAVRIQECPQLGSEIFVRGIPEKIRVEENPIYYLPLYDLLAALAAPLRRNKKEQAYSIQPIKLFSLQESAERLRRVLGVMPSWGALADFLPEIDGTELEVRSAVASTFAATLELVKAGELEIRQDGTFSPIYMRRKAEQTEGSDT